MIAITGRHPAAGAEEKFDFWVWLQTQPPLRMILLLLVQSSSQNVQKYCVISPTPQISLLEKYIFP